MKIVVYVGIDVHKDTNTVCLYTREENCFYELGKLPAGTEFLVKALKKAKKDFFPHDEVEWKAGYEAGPTGYGLCKGLQKREIDCTIMAPTTIKRASGDKVKTDRRDAMSLSQALANDAYKPVHLLGEEDLATREVTRLRTTTVNKLKKEKQNLLSFLLRLGKSYPESGSYWTNKHMEWLETLKFDDQMLDYAYRMYLSELKATIDSLERIDSMIESIAVSERYKENVEKLVCFAGIQTHTAVSVLCEIGDFKRFAKAEEFSSYLGLVPGQDSSGKTERYLPITKAGNSRLRLLLVEAAHGIRNSNPFNKSKRIKARQALASPEVVAYADRGSKRIKSRMSKLERNGKNANVAAAAGARELSCFIWGMMTGNIA